ncbi:Hypothetical predicted protein [Cloeon dipterum]|uniref:Chitin-binding type-2 domain-containing protein n=1 Tax=Cloeon dipterum TaxID=197152 RepID=A0A8S1CQ90_9INSE|nr:Hypothetical predicted protein [Cloeon dipterum]
MRSHHASVLSLVLLAAVAASPALAARRPVTRQQTKAAGASSALPKEVQRQWQVAVNRPPKYAIRQNDGTTERATLPPAEPGFMWTQVPITEVPPSSEAPHTTTEATESEAVAAVSTESAAAAVPPADPEMLKNCQQPRGQFPHPDECDKFYNCWDDVVALQACPADLVFSDQGAFCDFRENVDCSSRGGLPATPTEASAEAGAATTEAPAVDDTDVAQEAEEAGGSGAGPVSEEQLKEDIGAGCTEAFSKYRSSKSCDVFIICSHGAPYRFQCPETLNYNEELGVCDYPYRVDCGNSTSKFEVSGQQQEQQQAAGGATPEQIWRLLYQHHFQQQRLPADVSAYYGGFAHLPPVRVVPGYNLRG